MAKRTRYPNRTASRASKRRPSAPASPAGRSPLAPRPTSLDDVLTHDHDHDHDHAHDLPTRSSSGLTEAELQRAAELEAEANAKERAAIAESLRRRNRAQERERAEPADANAPLSVRAAHEYAYVARDVKRIALTASLMIGILAVFYLLINVFGVISI
jgi:hypothetical protein